WDAFARRTFREGPDGAPVLNYDPGIGVPIARGGAKVLAPNLWPFFGRLAKGRELLLVRGATSDLLDARVALKMKARAPHMAFAEVPGVGHAPMLDEPAARDAIADFLARVA
ncbi:MAG TPA: alpha/beta hydrolase, partial [Caulobacteraceae bacterium]